MTKTSPVEEDRVPFDWETRFANDDTPWERGAVHPAFEYWRGQGHFEAGLRVFVPGCGRSAEPEAFARLGLHVTGMDVAQSAIAWQEKRFAEAGLSGTFLEENALTWHPETPFDLFYEQTFLCAIHPHQREAYERAAYDQIRPGGKLLALFMQKEERGGPPYGCDLAAMHELFAPQRWDWPDGELPAFPHPRLGDKAERGAVLVRKG